jgi:EAL domain-containing protein (putative c-di-GMP-specific phosphodiesterase class I)
MYRAKEGGKNNFQFYSAQMDLHSASQLALESSLRRALERNELLLHYQAKVDAQTGRITGVEVLARWQHPELGLMHPEHFIPLAEETGLIVPLTKWVLHEACTQSKVWQKQGLPPMHIAVNLSARQFADENLLSDVETTLAEVGMDPTLLELEITESMMMHNTDKTIQVLAGLKKMGIRIAIDDFGIGYSSLSHLKQLPIDIIKIDRSFIMDIPGDQADEAIADAIIAMGKSLKILVVAEGVEALEQLQFLRSRGCDEIQGFFFSRPLPAQEFSKILRKNLAEHPVELVKTGADSRKVLGPVVG